MIPNWSPEAWNGIGVVAVVLIVGALLVTGRLITARQHREIIAGYQREAENKDARALKDADTINTLTQALVKDSATSEVTERFMAALREVRGER